MGLVPNTHVAGRMAHARRGWSRVGAVVIVGLLVAACQSGSYGTGVLDAIPTGSPPHSAPASAGPVRDVDGFDTSGRPVTDRHDGRRLAVRAGGGRSQDRRPGRRLRRVRDHPRGPGHPSGTRDARRPQRRPDDPRLRDEARGLGLRSRPQEDRDPDVPLGRDAPRRGRPVAGRLRDRVLRRRPRLEGHAHDARGSGPTPRWSRRPRAVRRQGRVRIVQFAFVPASLDVAVGTRVSWTNDDPTPHTVTADRRRVRLEAAGPGRQLLGRARHARNVTPSTARSTRPWSERVHGALKPRIRPTDASGWTG